MSDENTQQQKPEQIVAKQITDLLENAGLLLADRASNFKSALAAGQLKSEDWALEIDLATAPKEGNDEQ